MAEAQYLVIHVHAMNRYLKDHGARFVLMYPL